jgi:hypothetical protein
MTRLFGPRSIGLCQHRPRCNRVGRGSGEDATSFLDDLIDRQTAFVSRLA